MKTASENIM